VRPLPIPHLHDWRKIEVCLINFKKVEDDERCLRFSYNTPSDSNKIVDNKCVKTCIIQKMIRDVAMVLDSVTKKEFEDTKGVIRIRISKKNRQHNNQKKKYKRTNNLRHRKHNYYRITTLSYTSATSREVTSSHDFTI
jgi:hypothetical protein